MKEPETTIIGCQYDPKPEDEVQETGSRIGGVYKIAYNTRMPSGATGKMLRIARRIIQQPVSTYTQRSSFLSLWMLVTGPISGVQNAPRAGIQDGTKGARKCNTGDL